MLDRRIVSFDIETIPDPECGRRSFGLVGSDADVVHQMVRRRLEETDGATEYPAQPWHRVVSVCATILDPEAGTVEMRALGGELLDERSHLQGFYALVCDELHEPRLLSWNGAGYDLPVLRYRSMGGGVSARDFYSQSGARKYNHYLGRFHDLHVDLMDVLCSHGAAPRAGLSALCQAMGLPSKEFLERPIYEHVLDGDRERITEYCKLDTVSTLLVFLGWGVHCGWVSSEQLQCFMSAVRADVSRQEFGEWAAIATDLRAWPPYLSEPARDVVRAEA